MFLCDLLLLKELNRFRLQAVNKFIFISELSSQPRFLRTILVQNMQCNHKLSKQQTFATQVITFRYFISPLPPQHNKDVTFVSFFSLQQKIPILSSGDVGELKQKVAPHREATVDYPPKHRRNDISSLPSIYYLRYCNSQIFSFAALISPAR